MAVPIFHDYLLQNAATTGNGTAVDFEGQLRELAIYIIWSAGVSAGAIQVETADATDYTGTWSALHPAPVTFTASKQDTVMISGILKALRARISTNIVGGTVTVKLYAN